MLRFAFVAFVTIPKCALSLGRGLSGGGRVYSNLFTLVVTNLSLPL